MTRKVFITSNGGHDYSDAARFGELVFCTDVAIRKDDIAHMYREFIIAMQDAEEDDYVLVGSLTSMCMVAAGIMADRFGRLNCLIFRDGKYIDRTIMLESYIGSMS